MWRCVVTADVLQGIIGLSAGIVMPQNIQMWPNPNCDSLLRIQGGRHKGYAHAQE
jgi:hypothetical protein